MKSSKKSKSSEIERALKNFPQIVRNKEKAAKKKQAIKKEFDKAAPLILKQIGKIW